MNRKSLITAAALAAASLSTYAFDNSASSGSLTREQVKAELRDLKAAGLYQPYNEASPSPLDDVDRTLKISMIQERDQLAHATPSQQDLLAMADRADEAPAIVIESVPQDEATPIEGSSALPFDHPALHEPPARAHETPAQ